MEQGARDAEWYFEIQIFNIWCSNDESPFVDSLNLKLRLFVDWPC